MTAAEKIAALRVTHEAATEGPWMYGTPDDDCEQTRAEWMAECAKEPDGSAAGSLWVAWQQRDGELLIPAITGDGPTSERNAAAIAAAHNAFPALLTALEDVLALTCASDDGSEYSHHGHSPILGEPECPACWADSIRTAIEAALAEVDHG